MSIGFVNFDLIYKGLAFGHPPSQIEVRQPRHQNCVTVIEAPMRPSSILPAVETGPGEMKAFQSLNMSCGAMRLGDVKEILDWRTVKH